MLLQKSHGKTEFWPRQRGSLFNRSLLENIALGVPQNQINHMSIDRAVARAVLTDLVHFLPLGLNTVVGERT